ncbi:type I restriction endonuclease subunit R [Streptococcus ruminantium]|uniref:type I restriction endonuclease subunit R n=1 Tax=Streptococcus ruminantium TaxID=1917441 RepID=UPI0012DCE10E|nr:HsdR family type I site-specific deoxyribonuclease [Streptococcus ruminantium]BDD38068.1 type I restriction-modification system restriction subunit R [Streptococcus ruminantium]
MAKFTEEQLEMAIVELFQEMGYDYVDGRQIHRKNDEVLLEDDLRSSLIRRYTDLSDVELEKIIHKIKYIPSKPIYTANRNAFYLVNEGFNLLREDAKKEALHVEYIDFENPENNIFKVVNQFTVQDERERRPDMLLFINGIPVSIFEFKTAIKETTTIHDAWKQVCIRYKRDIPSLLKYTFLSVISDGANTKLGSIFTPYEYYYSWNKANDDEKVSNGISALLTMIHGAFAKDRVVAILRDFIYYPDSDKKETAIVTRYPQFFASIRMLDSIKEHMKPYGDGKGGTYFGATGSGKTNTMLFLSRLIGTHDREVFKAPTVIILVDRDDLSTQTSELFENSKRYLKTENVKTIGSRAELKEELSMNQSGGVYITTIQKFAEETGLLSERENIICISDEAHRTQTNVGAKLKYTDKGVETTYGFAKYLRDSFPNATYAGFTGTPIDETLHVFGPIVESYTMKEATDDGITVKISYEPRLARVITNKEQVEEIDKYYKSVEEEGANTEQIEASKRAMSHMSQILSHPDRICKVVGDIAEHYEKVVSEKPDIVQKAMIVCSDREHAYKVYKELEKVRPEWFVAKKTERTDLSEKELSKMQALPTVNIVATRGKDDEEDMYNLLGDAKHRKSLDKAFKDTKSNFQIVIVVDMWITGFDVPSLAVMYIDKPLKKHTLIQTISRVNRVFEGKDHGLVVDYIGIKRSMMEAIKMYGGEQESPIDELGISLKVFRNQLSLIDELLGKFDATNFYNGTPSQRLLCLNRGAEYVQMLKDMESRFMYLSRRMKSAYEIVFPSGELTDAEVEKAQFYLAIRSIIYKQTKGTAPDAETMNKHVQQMIENAIASTGVEDIVNNEKEELFDDSFLEQLNELEMPITKFNALLKLLKRAIDQYGATNLVKAIEFSKRLTKVVENYNNRDELVFSSEEMAQFVDGLSEEVMKILKDLQIDMNSFQDMGVSYEEKVFYDILIKVRDEHEFEYADDKCIELAKSIEELVDDKAQYADWSNREDIKAQLNVDLTVLLYENGYPPQWNEEVFEQVLGQAENFKKSLD